jgi:hypothetical protein
MREMNIPRNVRKTVLESFDVRTLRVRTAGNAEFGLRFFGGPADARGHFLFETFPASRSSLGLPLKWNEMHGFTQWRIRPGAVVFEGRVASQGYYTGGQMQKYVLNKYTDLLEP